MFKNKLFKLFICLFIVGGAFCTAFAASDATEEYKFLHELGIINEKVLIDDSDITRAEFAVMFANMHGYDGENMGNSRFLDVEDEYFAKNEISYLAIHSIVNGVSQDRFNPGQNIRTEDAYRVVFNALGYTDYVLKNYNTLCEAAASLELDKGISKSEVLSKKDAVKLLYNALNTEILEIEYKGGAYSVDFNSGKTPLDEWLKLDYAEGTVFSVGDAKINHDYKTGGLVVGDLSLAVSKEDNFYDYLGYYCRVYFDIETEEVESLIKISNKNDVSEYETEFSSFENGILTYNPQGKKKSIEINPQDDVVLNGVPVLASERDNALNNADGKIIINEVSGYDGKIVLINSYETYYAGGLSDENYTVYDKIIPGRILELDGEKSDIYMSFLNGEECDFLRITAGDVLTVLNHGLNGDKTVTVVKDKVSGTVSSVSEDDGTIDVLDTTYKFAKDFEGFAKELPSPGKQVTLYLDAFGRVAFIEEGGFDNYTYGFLYKTIISEDDDALRFKIYTQQGEFITVSTTEKLRIDGAVYSENSDKIEALASNNGSNGEYRLIRFRQNVDNAVFEVDTTEKGASEGENNSLKKVHSLGSDGSLYKQVPKAFGGTGEIGLRVVTDSSTVIMTVPTKETNDTDVFKIGKTFVNDTKYSFEAYKSNTNDIPADILLFYEETATVDEYAYGIITDLKVVYDSTEEEVVTSLTAVTSTMGEKIFNVNSEFDIKNSVVVDLETKITPDKGDVVKMALNAQSKIMSVEVMYDASEGKWLAATTPYGSIYNDHFYYGTINRKNSGYMEIAKGVIASEVSDSLLYPIPMASNVRYIKYNSITNKTENITENQILDFESVQNEASEAVIITRAANGVVVAVYE